MTLMTLSLSLGISTLFTSQESGCRAGILISGTHCQGESLLIATFFGYHFLSFYTSSVYFDGSSLGGCTMSAVRCFYGDHGRHHVGVMSILNVHRIGPWRSYIVLGMASSWRFQLHHMQTFAGH